MADIDFQSFVRVINLFGPCNVRPLPATLASAKYALLPVNTCTGGDAWNAVHKLLEL